MSAARRASPLSSSSFSEVLETTENFEPLAPLVLALVLVPLLAESLRQSLLVTVIVFLAMPFVLRRFSRAGA